MSLDDDEPMMCDCGWYPMDECPGEDDAECGNYEPPVEEEE